MDFDLIAELSAYLAAGGQVMPILCGVLFGLWFSIGYRLWLLRRGTSVKVEQLGQAILQGRPIPGRGVFPELCRQLASSPGQMDRPGQIDLVFQRAVRRLYRFRTLAKALVLIAPLLGLLGTVAGMIETFDSLAEMALFRQSGGIAGGIAKALFTTQLGLAVAIPGYFLLAVLERRQRRLESDLLRLQDLLHQTWQRHA
nr:MotA/TolQ/ExbB proton channel [uncultured Gammaproteobacteria bacterium]